MNTKIIAFNRIPLLGIFFILTVIFSSCHDDPSQLGADILPETDFFSPHANFDTKLSAINIKDTVNTNDAPTGLLGDLNDPVFGRTKAEMIFQVGASGVLTESFSHSKYTVLFEEPDTLVRPSTEKRDSIVRYRTGDTIFVTSNPLDSLLLNIILDNGNSYGDTSNLMNIKVFELSDLFDINTIYYSDFSMENKYFPTPLAEKMIKSKSYLSDTVNVYARKTDRTIIKREPPNQEQDSTYETYISNWTFKLPSELANKIYNLDISEVNNRSSLLENFKGFYIQAEMANELDTGCLVKPNLLASDLSNRTNLTLIYEKVTTHKYYDKEITGTDTTFTFNKDSITNRTFSKFSFLPGYEYVRVNRYEQGSNLDGSLNDPQSENLYVQGISGRYAKISIDPTTIEIWKDSLINSYESDEKLGFSAIDLEFTIDTKNTNIKTYKIPPKLSLKIKNEDGEYEFPTYTVETSSSSTTKTVFIDGYYSTSTPYSQPYAIKENNDTIYHYSFKMRTEYLQAYLNYLLKKDGYSLDGISDKEKGFVLKEDDILPFGDLYLVPEEDKNSVSLGISEKKNTNAKRVVLKSPNSKDGKLKLNIKYYKYNTQ